MIAYVDASVLLRVALGQPDALVEIDWAVLDRAAQPMPTELGTLDASHLATALPWKDLTHLELTMATHDAALAPGAQAYGLPVVGM